MYKIFKREIQSLVHPQKFVRLLKLTDGSVIHVSTLTPPIPSSPHPFTVSLLNLDSSNHPSWNPELRDRLLLDDRGQVAKFRAKFGGKESTGQEQDSTKLDSKKSDENNELDSTDYGCFLEMDPTLNLNESGNQLTKVKKKILVKSVNKKKK